MISAGSVRVCAPAKVNLCLHVGPRRADGYHDLESLVAFAAHGDVISLERDDSFSLSVTGPFAEGLTSGEDNLVLRAALRLAEKAGVQAGARVALQKNIPIASGVGGGSADAAAVLRGLPRLWNCDVDRETLHTIGASLGADIPVCLESAAAWIEKRGEQITLLPPFPKIWLLLVNPGVAVSTAEVFARLDQRRGLGLECPRTAFADVHALVEFLRSTTNDLEVPARAIAPVIDEVLEEIGRLPGVLLARMSGSGATCFSLFANESAVRAATALLSNKRPHWWIAGTVLAPESLAAPVFA